MGGMPTTLDAEVLADNTSIVPGLYAAGEVACVSVHGSNRLGTNSLLDINVFGRRAGIAAAEYASRADYVELPENPEADRKSTRLNSSHVATSYAVFCLKKKIGRRARRHC